VITERYLKFHNFKAGKDTQLQQRHFLLVKPHFLFLLLESVAPYRIRWISTIHTTERAVFSKQIAFSLFDVKVKISMPEIVARIVDRLEGIPGGIGEPRHSPEGGVLPEQITSVGFMQLDAEILMA
jgi:hypothetical protein